MKQGGDVWQIFSIEHAFILAWTLVVVIFIELSRGIKRLDTIFSVNRNQIDGIPMFGIVSISPNLLDMFRLNFGYWQILKNLDATCGCPASTSHCENHRGELFWDLFLFYFITDASQVRVTIFDIKVFVGAVAVQERCADAHLHYVLPESFEEVDGACHSCVFAKRDQSIFLVIGYFFIVDEADILLEEGIQCRHVM